MELIFEGKRPANVILSKLRRHLQPTVFDSEKNILIKGDCLEGGASLLAEFAGKAGAVYFDPPQNGYLSRGASGAKVSRDEYLCFIWERLAVAKELLSEKGSLYVHVSSREAFEVKLICDELFGEDCFKNDLARIRANPRNSAQDYYGCQKDTVLFYTKNPDGYVWNDVKIPISENEYSDKFSKVDEYGRRYATVALHAPGQTKSGATGEKWRGLAAPAGRHWMTTPEELDRLDAEGRIEWSASGNPRLIVYGYEYEGKRPQDVWDFKDPPNPSVPGEKNREMLELIIKQSSEKGSLLVDMFAGSGAFLRACEGLKRRYIGIESDAVAVDAIMAKAQVGLEFADLDTGHRQTVVKEHHEQLSMFDDLI